MYQKNCYISYRLPIRQATLSYTVLELGRVSKNYYIPYHLPIRQAKCSYVARGAIFAVPNNRGRGTPGGGGMTNGLKDIDVFRSLPIPLVLQLCWYISILFLAWMEWLGLKYFGLRGGGSIASFRADVRFLHVCGKHIPAPQAEIQPLILLYASQSPLYLNLWRKTTSSRKLPHFSDCTSLYL